MSNPFHIYRIQLQKKQKWDKNGWKKVQLRKGGGRGGEDQRLMAKVIKNNLFFWKKIGLMLLYYDNFNVKLTLTDIFLLIFQCICHCQSVV